MIVKLINYTPDPERTVAIAAKTSHSREIPEYSDEKHLTEKEIGKIITVISSIGHHSVLEHASFTFAVEGVSRALTHQLVRHRIASYTQQSQRYVNLDNFGYITPPSVKNSEVSAREYRRSMEYLAEMYRELIEFGVPMEDARYVLPNAATTAIVVTMNARELLHFFSLRCCERSQWEIRELAYAMLDEVKEVAPDMFRDAGPPCIRGPCPEGRYSCGKPKSGKTK